MKFSENCALLIGILLLVAAPIAAQAQSDQIPVEPTDPLAFFEPFIGVWLPQPDWPPMADNPALQQLVPLNFSWDQTKKSIKIEEGLPAFGQYTSGILVWNAAEQQARFTAWQNVDELVFDGFYEASPNGMRRIYDVVDRKGAVRKFRETFALISQNQISWLTEQWTDGKWVSRSGNGKPEFQAVRATKVPTDRLKQLSPLTGNWHPDISTLSESYIAWQVKNNITDSFVSFSFGTDQRWMEFADFRKQDGKWRHQGAGIIAWHPGRHLFSFTEHGAKEVAVEGNIEILDEHTYRRNIKVSTPGGKGWVQRDTLTISVENPDCMSWQTTYVDGAKQRARPAYTLCRGAGVLQGSAAP